MTILFDATRTVKPAARRPFASGLTRTRPAKPVAYTQEDAAWWAENSPANREGFEVVGPSDSRLDDMAEQAAFLASYEAGFVPC